MTAALVHGYPTEPAAPARMVGVLPVRDPRSWNGPGMRTVRRCSGLTLGDAARLFACSLTFLSDMERGERVFLDERAWPAVFRALLDEGDRRAALPCDSCSQPRREHRPRGGRDFACPAQGTTYQSPEAPR